MKENTLEERSLELPDRLRAKLRDFQRTVWIAKLLEGLLAAVFGFAMAYLAVFVLDRFWNTPASLRALILVAGASGLGFWFPIKCHRWIWQRRSLEQVARLLRHRFPRLGDQLLGIVELARHASGSEALIKAAFRQADEAVAKEEFTVKSVPESQLRRWILGTGAVAAIFVVSLVFVPKAAWNALVRGFAPWLDTERYTFAQVEKAPRSMVVPYGEPFELNLALREGSDWSPETARAWFHDQTPVLASLDTDAQKYRFEMQPRVDKGRMHLRIGDEKQSVSVTPAPRPELTSMVASVRLPDYLRYERPLEVQVLDGSISIVEGSEASFKGKTSRDLAFAIMDGINQRVEGAAMHLDPLYVTESVTRNIQWKDELGLSAKKPLELKIRAHEDGEPTVASKMITEERVVLEGDVVRFDVRVQDDFGVQEVGLAWVGEAPQVGRAKADRGSKISAAGHPEMLEVKTEATFSAARERVRPQTIQIAAYALDYMPGRRPVYSQAMVLHIMSPEDHAVWLTGELGKWFRRAQEVYEREKQLHMTNQELRKLSAEELDKPENRSQIEGQAAAEQVNAKRLENLTESGREMLESAARNDEFDAVRLELWAQMLDQLGAIAKNRMPSVADLLKDAAGAQNADPSQVASGDMKPGGESKPGQSSPSESQPGQSKPSQGSSGSEESEEGRSESVAETKENSQGGDGPGGQSKPGMSMGDQESGFMPDVKSEGKQEGGGSGGGLGLPGTSLGATPTEGGQEQQPSPAQAKTQEAVVEQTGLLDEFARIADQLKELLGSLEASTFVKRLKAASREQLEIAGDLNKTLMSAFGRPKANLEPLTQEDAEGLALREEEQGELVHTIQEDMEAFFHRKRDMRYKNVLDQMQEMGVVAALQDIGGSVRRNRNGRSIAAAEFWADNLDRWAEEMVSASESEQANGEQESDSLPPKIVLEVMKILHEEIELREETRELEKAKDALEGDAYPERALDLAETQKKLRNRTYKVTRDIQAIPGGSQRFSKPIQKLTQVSQVMDEAARILNRPDTGPEAIAAETEAIELLMEARRQNPNGGGGGGSSPGGGGAGAAGMPSALSGIGPGADLKSKVEEREVKQATGKEERQIPEEFRDGLDAYFNALERER